MIHFGENAACVDADVHMRMRRIRESTFMSIYLTYTLHNAHTQSIGNECETVIFRYEGYDAQAEAEE